MTSDLWSINRLAIEFRLDRRTVAKRIDGIAPAGTEKGSDVWKLVDVAPALIGHTGGGNGTVEALGLRLYALTAPAAVASAAVAAGLSVEMAFRLFRACQAAMITHAGEVAHMIDCPAPFAADEGDLDGAFMPPDWNALAGGIADLDAWAQRLDQPMAFIAMGAAK